jgi:hypothetical protein
MEAPVDATLCVSRVLSFSPAEAEAALASCEASLTTAPPGQRGRVLVALRGGTAELHPAPLAGASRGCRRRLVGVLRSEHRWFSVPIEVEVGPGSPTVRAVPMEAGGRSVLVEPDRAELRVRPIGPTCLRSLAHHRLFTRLAPALVERVASELRCAAEVPCA